jgi:tetratricopeptide (TPR) repeat protein
VSAQNSGGNVKDNAPALGIAIGVITLIAGLILGIMGFTDQIPAGRQVIGLSILGALLIILGGLLIARHQEGKWLGVFTLLAGVGFIVYAAAIGYGVTGRGESSPVGGECSDYYNRKLYQQAADCYKKGGKLADSFEAKLQLGLSYLQLKKYEEAAAVLKDIYSQDPDRVRPHIVEAYYALALAEATKGNTQKTIRYKTILRTYDPAMADKLESEAPGDATR